MRLHISILIAGFLVVPVGSLLASGNAQVEIRKYRFQPYREHNFDRLVLEFSEHGKPHEAPQLLVSPAASGRETTVQITGATLVGAIPESAINESYSGRSKFLGPVAINTDNPVEGFSVRTYLKVADSQVDAFWLEHPRRLVIDIYPKGSARAAGPHIVSESHAAAAPTHGHHPRHAKAKASGPAYGIYCFPVTSRVVATVGFKNNKAVVKEKPYYNAKEAAEINSDDVACYPAAALLKPFINFATGGEPVPAVSAVPHTAALPPPAEVPKTAVLAPQPHAVEAPKPIVAMPQAPVVAPIIPAAPPIAINSTSDDVFDDMDLFGPAPVTQAAKDAPPPTSLLPQRIPSSPPIMPPVNKNGLPTLPGLGGLLPPRKAKE